MPSVDSGIDSTPTRYDSGWEYLQMHWRCYSNNNYVRATYATHVHSICITFNSLLSLYEYNFFSLTFINLEGYLAIYFIWRTYENKNVKNMFLENPSDNLQCLENIRGVLFRFVDRSFEYSSQLSLRPSNRSNKSDWCPARTKGEMCRRWKDNLAASSIQLANKTPDDNSNLSQSGRSPLLTNDALNDPNDIDTPSTAARCLLFWAAPHRLRPSTCWRTSNSSGQRSLEACGWQQRFLEGAWRLAELRSRTAAQMAFVRALPGHALWKRKVSLVPHIAHSRQCRGPRSAFACIRTCPPLELQRLRGAGIEFRLSGSGASSRVTGQLELWFEALDSCRVANRHRKRSGNLLKNSIIFRWSVWNWMEPYVRKFSTETTTCLLKTIPPPFSSAFDKLYKCDIVILKTKSSFY